MTGSAKVVNLSQTMTAISVTGGVESCIGCQLGIATGFADCCSESVGPIVTSEHDDGGQEEDVDEQRDGGGVL